MTDAVTPYRENHLVMPVVMSFDEWQEMGVGLQTMHKSVLWWLGDWLRFGEHKYGEKYAQAVNLSGRTEDTLRSALWVSSRFADVKRRRPLSWTHHREVASLPEDEADELLALAEQSKLTCGDLRAIVVRRKGAKPKLLLTGPENGAQEPKTDPVNKSVRESSETDISPINFAGDKKELFVEFWEKWISMNFPGHEPTKYGEVADWWWDALLDYKFVEPTEKAA